MLYQALKIHGKNTERNIGYNCGKLHLWAKLREVLMASVYYGQVVVGNQAMGWEGLRIEKVYGRL